MVKDTLKLLKEEVYWGVLGKALLSLLPVAIGYIWTGNVMFWNVGLITISLGIGAERLKLGAIAISLHFLLILACFTLLFFAFTVPYLFVLVCASMAFATIYFIKYGSGIRTLANYTFIPTVYLTCELHENISSALTVAIYEKFIILTPLALLAAILIYRAPKMRIWRKKPELAIQEKSKKGIARILHGVELGEPTAIWIPSAIAIFLGVTVAASLVIFLHLSRGEWVIWSVASVITLEFSSARRKFNDRMLGACIGVPLGLLAAEFAPKSELMYVFAALGIMLTLVAFRRYRLAFGSRCFLVAFAAFIVSATPIMAVERITNVLAGGAIGLLAVYFAELIFNEYILKIKRGKI